MDIVLSKRLSTIASLVEKDSIVADIGADHGYLICSLVKNNIIKKGYAVDGTGQLPADQRVAPPNKVDITPQYTQTIVPLDRKSVV